MSARCDWHVGDLGLPDDTDPLQEIIQLKSTAAVIDLTTTEEELFAQLSTLVDAEGRYFQYSKDDDGVTPLQCELKWTGQHTIMSPSGQLTCFNCPHHVSDRDSAKSLICNLGRKQQNIVEQIRGLRIVASLETEMISAFERDIEEAAELAEAWLAAA